MINRIHNNSAGTPRNSSVSARVSSGFTLIELLIISAIIAILTAVLFSCFRIAREKARQSTCLTNTKQLGIAIMQYTQDYDETYPNGTSQFSSIGGWAGQVYPYVKSAELFRCPSDLPSISPKDKPTSYGMNNNFNIDGNLDKGIPNRAVRISDATTPAKTVMLFEVAGNTGTDVTLPLEGLYPINYNSSPFGNGLIAAYSPSGGGTFPTCPATGTLKYATGYLGGQTPGNLACHFTGPNGRHNSGSTYLMADGHAQWFLGRQVSPGSNAPSKTAAQDPQGYHAAGTMGTIDGVPIKVTFSVR